MEDMGVDTAAEAAVVAEEATEVRKITLHAVGIHVAVAYSVGSKVDFILGQPKFAPEIAA